MRFKMSKFSKELRLRLISSVVMIFVTLFSLWAGGFLWFSLVLAGGVGAGFECWNLCKTRTPSRDNLWFIFLGAYIILAFFGLLHLRDVPFDIAFGVLCLVALFDSAAYFGGKTIRGPRLWVAISPNKTWSGFIVGVASSLFFGYVYFGMIEWLILGAAIGFLAQGGDLLVSAIKRRADKKDSSNLIAGHGGLLDRLAGYLSVGAIYGIVLLFF